jgi:hypothetical protein
MCSTLHSATLDIISSFSQYTSHSPRELSSTSVWAGTRNYVTTGSLIFHQSPLRLVQFIATKRPRQPRHSLGPQRVPPPVEQGGQRELTDHAAPGQPAEFATGKARPATFFFEPTTRDTTEEIGFRSALKAIDRPG